MDKQLGRPVLVEFWDFCRANSLRTLPYVRAWHERYAARRAARDLRPRRRLSAVAATRPRCAPRSRASGSSTRSCIDARASRSGATTATRAGRRATSSTSGCGCTRCHYGEGAYDETERRSASCSASPCEPLRAAAPRGRPRRAARGADGRAAGRVVGPVRGRRRVGGARAHGAAASRPSIASTARRSRSRTRALSRSSSTSATPRACSSSRSATGVDLPRRAVHAGRRGLTQLAGEPIGRSPSRRSRRGGPSSSSAIAPPGQYGLVAARPRPMKCVSKTQQPALCSCVPAGVRHSRGVVAGQRPGAVRVAEDRRARRRGRSRAHDLGDRRAAPARRSVGAAERRAAPGPRPARLTAATADAEAARASAAARSGRAARRPVSACHAPIADAAAGRAPARRGALRARVDPARRSARARAS